MSVRIDPPCVYADSAREQVHQLVVYLRQLAEQLNMAFEELEVMASGEN